MLGPTCTPEWTLIGASEDSFNPKLTQFTAQLPCQMLDTNNYVVFGNFQPVFGTTNTTSSILIPGFEEDYVLLSIFALDINGNAFFESWQLLFGSVDMPVLVLGVDGNPASGVTVQANATTYVSVGQSGTTDSSGMVTFTNLIETTIGLVARDAQNQIGVDGIAATPLLVTMHLIPYNTPSNITNFGFANGTQGWSGGTLVSVVDKRDNGIGLDVSTNSQYDLQTVSATFKTFPFTETAYIRYMFQTDEVPGGYFGTQFNDYFVIIIRDDIGDYTTYENSMNGLGIGAFDSDGATQWYTLTLDVVNAKSVQFDVGVSNVVDNLYQSQVIIDKVGDLTCDGCGDCSTCPGDPMCQDVCQNPPSQSCAFYRNCVEATDHCGPGGYPLAFGEKNCNKFQNNLLQFSATGQTWIWATALCLQQALVPVATSACDASTACSIIQQAAFDSHPACYVNSGFCSLEPSDYIAVITTVGGDLFSLEALKEIALTAAGCVENIISGIESQIQSLAAEVVTGVEQAAVNAAEIIALTIARKFFQSLLPQ